MQQLILRPEITRKMPPLIAKQAALVIFSCVTQHTALQGGKLRSDQYTRTTPTELVPWTLQRPTLHMTGTGKWELLRPPILIELVVCRGR